MLSRQYRPEDHDSSESEEVVPLQRNRSFANRGSPLTINELQKLEELAEQAAESGDSSKFTSMLRRSLSMRMTGSGTLQHLFLAASNVNYISRAGRHRGYGSYR
jgi:hypothetical protein